MKTLKLSIIIPCLNEAQNIATTLHRLQKARNRGHEIILCDGGSRDNTVKISQPLVDHLLNTAAGRATQMNAGAHIAKGNVLCFLHADTLAPENIDEIILNAFTVSSHRKVWGFFTIKLSSSRWPFRIIEWLINKRSCITKIASGDQGIFIKKSTFQKLSGYTEIPLMEDINISKHLKKLSHPVCIKSSPLITSSRRWEKHGIIRTVLLMWRLRFAYFCGAPADTLSKVYKNHAADK